MHHIKECLPTLKVRITAMLIELDHELISLGTPFAATDKAGKSEQLLHLISKFSTNFNNAITQYVYCKNRDNDRYHECIKYNVKL